MLEKFLKVTVFKFSRSKLGVWQRALYIPMGACVSPITENKMSVFAKQLILRHSVLYPQRWRPEQRRGPELAGGGCVLEETTYATLPHPWPQQYSLHWLPLHKPSPRPCCVSHISFLPLRQEDRELTFPLCPRAGGGETGKTDFTHLEGMRVMLPSRQHLS